MGYLFLALLIIFLLSPISTCSGESVKEFDERRYPSKHYPNKNNYRPQASSPFADEHHPSNEYTYLETKPKYQDRPTSRYDYRSSPVKRTSTSSLWLQQYPIAAPIRSNNFITDSSEFAVTSFPINSDRSTYSSDLQQDTYYRTNNSIDSKHNNLSANKYSQQQSDPSFQTNNVQFESTTISSDAENLNSNSKDIAGYSNVNDSSSIIIDKSNDFFSSRISDSIYPTTAYTLNSSTKLQEKNDDLYKDEVKNEKDLFSSPAALNNSNTGQNYQQSTIKLTSIKTFESSTETITSIADDNYANYNSLSKHSINWWSLGSSSGVNQATKLTKENYLDFCQTTNLLSTNKQRALCQIDPKIMPIIAKGLKTAIEECQYQFSSSRWNCSIIDDRFDYENQEINGRNLKKTSQRPDFVNVVGSNTTLEPIFGGVMAQQNRERSFLSAIMSAGIAHAITKACSRGELSDECGCDQRVRNRNNRGKWEWGGCSEDIDYGVKFSREFTDSTEFESDPASMINIHNYEVGRRVLKSTVDLTCKCHGVSGSCAVRTCWKRLGLFREVGNEIVARYERATHVQPSSQPRSSRSKLRPVKRGARKPNKKDLVFIDESPDYCNENKRLGILGTKNRKCNSTSDGLDGCRLLCCGRGYQNIIEDIEEDCECKFVWCCEVKCQKCKQRIEYDSCN